ncbi:MAG TPA: CDP-diacylglycerol--serine O-phosphatidyltransferase [Candidatus Caccoplasma intestinavium]|jgi:CDP-diacylglycerol--serine O-phosphatidyltransferase|uniref:CDP-diacylglycerol--serine O-phosphatidyltransferase n=1 Tax=Candidatus Caccoplasma intestinavium TaxID=2840716 RepID=A0A9D1GG59_9BACT|nr:CDP-diacylglycerol--serine O-phosphatidyltransferase [Candidatus Caccoplasma intestinavium]
MKRLSSYIPNIITCCNLTAGSLAVIMALRGTFEQAAIFILIAAVCDFLDGLSARLLHAYSDMGKELDSLSDLISFGLAPGLMVYALLNDYLLLPYGNLEYLAYIALLIPVAGGIRLAKFNVDDRQTTSFIGLPIPANALFWIGVCFADTRDWHPVIILALIVLFSYLMVSNLPMFSLKASNLSWSNNKLRYILIITSLGLIIWLGLTGLAGAIIAYILLSLIAWIRK